MLTYFTNTYCATVCLAIPVNGTALVTGNSNTDCICAGGTNWVSIYNGCTADSTCSWVTDSTVSSGECVCDSLSTLTDNQGTASCVCNTPMLTYFTNTVCAVDCTTILGL